WPTRRRSRGLAARSSRTPGLRGVLWIPQTQIRSTEFEIQRRVAGESDGLAAFAIPAHNLVRVGEVYLLAALQRSQSLGIPGRRIARRVRFVAAQPVHRACDGVGFRRATFVGKRV